MSRMVLRMLVSAVLVAVVHIATAGPADSLVAAARKAVEAGKFSEAQRAATAASKADPDDYRAFYYLAMAEKGLGRDDAARAASARAVELAPADAKAQTEKLAQLVGGGQKAAPTRAPYIFISCTYATTTTFPGDKEEKKDSEEVMRLGDGSFSYWDRKRAEWTEEECISKKDDKAFWKISVKSCELTDSRFTFKYMLRSSTAEKHHSYEQERVINRLSGTLSAKGSGKTELGGRYSVIEEGICRPVNDPSTARAKF